MQFDKVIAYNINDSVGEFTYKVSLSDNVMFDEETGYLYCNNVIVGNVGVQLYGGNELGINQRVVKVHRLAEHIFDEKSLESLVGKPVTIKHPKEMVTSENVGKYGKGTMYGTPRVDGDNILMDMVIQDKQLVNLVTIIDSDGERRLNPNFRDVSLGYTAKLTEIEDGEYVQENIKYNHLAIVPEGRASNAMIVDEANKEINGKEKSLMGILSKLFKKGDTIKIVDEDTVKLLDEEVEAEKELTDEEKEQQAIKDAEIKEKELKDAEEAQKIKDEQEKLEKEKKEKEVIDSKMEITKDKAFYKKAFMDAQALPNGAIKDDLIAELNDEYTKAFPKKEASVLNDVKVITDAFGGQGTLQDEEIDFQFLEDEKANYYAKLTDPTEHANYKEYDEFHKKEQRLGKTKFNR